jgi:hypothetical protein
LVLCLIEFASSAQPISAAAGGASPQHASLLRSTQPRVCLGGFDARSPCRTPHCIPTTNTSVVSAPVVPPSPPSRRHWWCWWVSPPISCAPTAPTCVPSCWRRGLRGGCGRARRGCWRHWEHWRLAAPAHCVWHQVCAGVGGWGPPGCMCGWVGGGWWLWEGKEGLLAALGLLGALAAGCTLTLCVVPGV